MTRLLHNNRYRRCMKAYVHDRYVFAWWAEAVLSMLMRHFGVDGTSKLYTLYSSHDFFVIDGKKIQIITALPKRLNHFFARWATSRWKRIRFFADYRNLLFFLPQLTRLLQQKIKHDTPEQLIVSSFAGVKNIVPTWGWDIPTISYIHSPMQYIWENYDEYTKKLTWIKWALFRRRADHLRARDSKKRSYDKVYANSQYTKSCVKHYYDLAATVWYPKIDAHYLESKVIHEPRDYLVYVWRLVQFIREVDRIIDLCNSMQLPLLILGSWPDEAILKERAGDTIVFLWAVTDPAQKLSIVQQAQGLINIAKESCGMSTIEALLAGVPVFGFAAWWTRELVWLSQQSENEWPITTTECGVFVTDKNPSVLIEAMHLFRSTHRNRGTIRDYILWVLAKSDQ